MIERAFRGIWQTALVGGLAAGLGAPAWGQIVVNAPDFDKTLHLVETRMAESGKDMVGVVLPMDLDVLAEANHTVGQDVHEWRLTIRAEGALATCLHFDDFHLPAGATLRCLTPKGAFAEQWSSAMVDATENNAHHRWANDEVPGEEVELVLTMPLGTVELPRLHVEGLGFFVRGTHFDAPFDAARGGAEACQVDVNCPEGDSWQCERDGVVRLRITQSGGIFYCSGSMINNTAKDCRQLMLTSLHCADEVDDDEWAYFKVQFNYEFSECGGTSSINSRTRTGVIPLTDSNDMANGQINGSDFLLVEVEDPISIDWSPFFAGWDASGNPGQGGVGIHHPSGDRKKISTYTNTLSTSSAYAPGAHWRVNWVSTETNHGVTEGGSSGSPIFSENHHIVGTLSGGSSFCSAPFAPDFYGKMSRHWSVNSQPDTLKLSRFLDPMETGQLAQHGSYKHVDEDGIERCDMVGSCDATRVEESFLQALTVGPNPTDGRVQVSVPHGASLERVEVYDAMGRWVQTVQNPSTAKRLSLDLQGKGLHYVTVRCAEGWSATRKVVVD